MNAFAQGKNVPADQGNVKKVPSSNQGRLCGLVLLWALAALLLAQMTAHAGGEAELLVGVKAGSESIPWPEGVRRVRNMPGTGIYRVWVDPEKVDKAIEILVNSSVVLFVEESEKLELQASDSPLAWQETIKQGDLARLSDGAGVVVGVVDTGIDLENPDFSAALYRNSAEIPGDGIDNDENGFVDDVTGYDFGDYDADPQDENGHGAGVSGIVLRTAPGCRILPLKANESGSRAIGIGAAVEAVFYAIGAGAQVINMSFSGPASSIGLQIAVRKAFEEGIVMAAAAGNNYAGPVEFPANMEEVIAVGSLDTELELAYFSATGEELDITAPGINIETTGLLGLHTSESGTSVSTPMVSGAVAVLRGMNPYLGPATTREVLLAGTSDRGEPGRDPIYGAGVLDGAALFAMASPRLELPPAPNFAYEADEFLTVTAHLPPTDAPADIYVGLIGEDDLWWLAAGGRWRNILEYPLLPVASVEAYSEILDGVLFGAGGVYPAFDPAFLAPGAYDWVIGILDKAGRLLGPVNRTAMSLN